METNNYKEMAHQMDKQGIRIFTVVTAVVYGMSVLYCYLTNHLFEAGLVGVVMIGLGILIGAMYKSA